MSASRRSPLLLLLLSGGAGCVEGYELQLVPVVANNQAPFDGLETLDLVVVPPSGVEERFALGAPESGASPTADGLPPLDGAVIEVEGGAAGAVTAWGRTGPLTSEAGGSVEAGVLVTETEAVAWLGEVPDGVARGMLALAGDGRFVLAGGQPDTRTGTTVDTVRMLDLVSPTAVPEFVEAGALPAYMDGEGETHTGRLLATLTPLSIAGDDEGLLLLAGGCNAYPYDGNGQTTVTAAASLYDPSAGTWTSLAADVDLSQGRCEHLALENVQGNVVIWGGWGYADLAHIAWTPSFELYNRDTREFEVVGSSDGPGPIAAAITDLGTDGTLVCGGVDYGDHPTWSASDRCALVSLDGSSVSESIRLPLGLAGHAMVTLDDGRVLVTGGVDSRAADVSSGPWDALADAWIYSPSSDSWSGAGAMRLPRAGHAMTRLADGRVLIAGGAVSWDPIYAGKQSPVSCVEVFDPARGGFVALDDCTENDESGGLATRAGRPMLAQDPTRGVLVVGGYNGENKPASTVGLYVPAP